MSLEVRCGFGLGNRVAAIANGLSRAEKISFVWRVNEHCPLTHEQVFPAGISGVEFVTDAPPAFATMWAGMRCHCWHAAADRNAADQAYGRIISAMNAAPAQPGFIVGACVRFFRDPETTPQAMAAHVRTVAKQQQVRRVSCSQTPAAASWPTCCPTSKSIYQRLRN
jgi:hypothetical protein